MQNNNKFFYFHAPKYYKVRCTVAAMNDRGIMKFAIARCGKRDQFNKKTGRRISIGRLVSGEIVWSSDGWNAGTFDKERFIDTCIMLCDLFETITNDSKLRVDNSKQPSLDKD